MIPQMQPSFGQEEADAVTEYMQGGYWLTEYWATPLLEKMITDYLGVKHCIMMPNCTLAIYASLMVLNIGDYETALVPAMTMIATANAVRMTGTLPIFTDVNGATLCMSLDDARQKIQRYTRALVYVSLNGRCGHMEQVVEFCAEHNIWLIEDAAQSLGSCWKGQPLGTFGDIGCFSLSCQKIISTGNGGFCVTDDDDLAHKLRLFKDFGRERGGSDDYQSFGINLKFTDLQAVVGIEQMKKLPQRVERKKEIYALYDKLLWTIPQVQLIPTDMVNTAPWFVDVLVEGREELLSSLKTKDIGTRAMYPALHKTPVYKGTHGIQTLPVSEKVAQKGLWLPSSVTLTDEEIETVCQHIAEFYQCQPVPETVPA